MNSMDKNLVLGVSNLDDSGVALLHNNGEIIFAINEERLNREKLYAGYPNFSLKCISSYKDNIKVIAIANISSFTAGNMYDVYYRTADSIFTRMPFLGILGELVRILSRFLARIYRPTKSKIRRQFGINKIKSIEHHLAHAAGAFYPSNKNKALIITMDAYGDGNSCVVALGEGRNIKILKTYGWGATAAHLYARITQYLGFKSHRDEGKVMGLAAYGDYSECYSEMEKLLYLDEDNVIQSAFFLRAGFNKKKMDKLFKDKKKEDIAAALQRRVEDVVTEFVKQQVLSENIRDVVLSGGVFANVKLNQKIHNLPEVNSIFVFPHMGDGGLSMGAALAMIKPKPFYLKSIYLGTEFSHGEIENILKDNVDVKFIQLENMAIGIAKILSEGKIVGIFRGKMEYGPRALGNRSILYQATDPNAKDLLNRKLRRTEFMPFAPMTLLEYSEQCYENIGGAEYCARFMTISFNATAWMKQNCPGAVHVDGTVRPQILTKEDNAFCYEILDEYRKLTKIPSVLNTSFNMHEEPIVATPQQALKAFLESGLDYLVIESYLMQLKEGN